jgi:hypothetical protein
MILGIAHAPKITFASPGIELDNSRPAMQKNQQ